jgi:hypothetical protein
MLVKQRLVGVGGDPVAVRNDNDGTHFMPSSTMTPRPFAFNEPFDRGLLTISKLFLSFSSFLTLIQGSPANPDSVADSGDG